MAKEIHQNNDQARKDRKGPIDLLRKNIVMRAALVILTVILTMVLLFSLTVAWLTNVTQTGGLTFTAEQWDFDGKITLEEGSVAASPGDEGIVGMEIQNHGARMVAASVTVSKDGMDERMKSRMYFYVDTPMVRNGEYMDRVWVSAKQSYTYTVLPNSSVVFNEAKQNAPALKWMWVYDLLGYYVLGTGTTGEGDITSVSVQEYIRPIEYDFDELNTTFNGQGALETIDGRTKVSDFLRTLTASDGYEGVIDTTVTPTDSGYYPVDVDENGYGVWLYLCTYNDILTNTTVDTQLGSEQVSCSAKITVSGQNSRAEALAVSDEQALIEALSSPLTGAVELANDIALTEAIELTEAANALLDLNGHTLSSSAESIFTTEPGARLTLINGSIEGGEDTVTGVAANGAYVLLSNITISGVDEGITIFDHENEVGGDSNIHITDCTITGEEDALWIYGNADASERNTSVVIEDSTLTGNTYTGIICNGSKWGTDIQISGSTVTGYFAGIYFPQQNSTLALTDCTVSGQNGIVAKGGMVTIEDCKISGTGSHTSPAYANNGWTDTGDGVYLEAAYAWNTTVIISGDETEITAADTANGAMAVRQYQDTDTQASITVSGGRYNTDVTAYLAEGAISSLGGDGFYTVTADDAEADAADGAEAE